MLRKNIIVLNLYHLSSVSQNFTMKELHFCNTLFCYLKVLQGLLKWELAVQICSVFTKRKEHFLILDYKLFFVYQRLISTLKTSDTLHSCWYLHCILVLFLPQRSFLCCNVSLNSFSDSFFLLFLENIKVHLPTNRQSWCSNNSISLIWPNYLLNFQSLLYQQALSTKILAFILWIKTSNTITGRNSEDIC